MASQLHQGLVNKLTREIPGSRTKGWRKHLIAALEPFTDEIDPPNRIPDVYKIDWNRQIVSVYEVEISGPMDSERLAEWAHLWAELDAHDWALELHVVDRLGYLTEARLSVLYYALLHNMEPAT